MSLQSETLFCEAGNHMWMREKKRGRKPTICPEHRNAPLHISASVSTAEVITQPFTSSSTIDELCNEIFFLENKIFSLEEDYSSLLHAASSGTRSHNETTKLFDKCDRLQSDIINIAGRLRKVRRQYNQIAGKDASQNCRE